MIPRVFISSTYYDLKHVRERLETFIENYGFEPILFESDKVTYQHGKPIDQSAYYEVELCHIMVLIIGGRYGSPSSQENIREERKIYDEEFVSITRKEFETAMKKNMPILIFLDKNVNSDYETYKENQDFFDDLYSSQSKEKKKFKFAHVDHVNIFKFIDVVKTLPVKTFEKVEEIEAYIKNQLSGLFYLYLESLKKKSEDNKILDTISELNNVTLRMNEMLTSVGKEILGKDKKEYEKVIDNQLSILLGFFVEKFSAEIAFEKPLPDEELDTTDLDRIVRILYLKALKINIPTLEKWTKFEEFAKFNKSVDDEILQPIQKEISRINDKIIITRFNYRNLSRELKIKVLPFIRNQADEELLIERLKKALKLELSELPF